MTEAELAELDRLLSQGLEPKAKALSPPDYLSFLQQTVPAGWSTDAPHIRLIVEHLDAVERGEIDRLAIHMPPRHSKSETTTIRYPVYSLSRRPDENVLLTGFNERFARRLGRKARTVAQGLSGGVLNLSADKHGTDEWATREGGVLMTRGVGSPPTGTGFGRIVVDDPIRRREDADSETFREKVWDWYTDDLYTRLEPGGAMILVMTRWHEDDSTLPKLKDVCTIWDLALKAKEENDETACITVGTGVNDGQLYVIRVRHGRWETPNVGSFLISQADWLKSLFGAEYRGDYVEDKVSGTTLMQYVRVQRPDLALIPISVEGDKQARAHGITPLLEAGRVLFPDISSERVHTNALIQQLMSFPGGKHDDMTDVFVYSILRFMGRLNQKQSRRGKGGGFV